VRKHFSYFGFDVLPIPTAQGRIFCIAEQRTLSNLIQNRAASVCQIYEADEWFGKKELYIYSACKHPSAPARPRISGWIATFAKGRQQCWQPLQEIGSEYWRSFALGATTINALRLSRCPRRYRNSHAKISQCIGTGHERSARRRPFSSDWTARPISACLLESACYMLDANRPFGFDLSQAAQSAVGYFQLRLSDSRLLAK